MKTFIALLALITCSTTQAAELFFEKDTSLPLVYVTAGFRGGATQDPDHKSGTTDLMGSLMIRGTKTKSKQQIDLALDQMGGSIEFETRGEFIAFRGAVLSDQLGNFLNLLAEILTEPSFREEELAKLKEEQTSQILNELSQDRSLIRLRFDEFFFNGHPYSKPAEGKVADIKNITTNDLQKQYQKLISQENMIFLATGQASKGNFSEFMNTIEKQRNIKSAVSPIPDFNNSPKKPRYIIFDKPDRTQTQVLIGQKGLPITSPDLDALQLSNHAFGGGSFQARLMVELRVKRGWTYGAGSNFKFGSKGHSWKVAFFPKNADTPPAIKQALKMIVDLKNAGLTQKEFDASKQSLINSAGFAFDTPAKRLENRMIEAMFGLPDGYYKNTAERLEKLTLAQVNQAMKNFLTPEHMMIGLIATASITKPEIAKTLGVKESDIEVQDYQKE